MTILHSHQARFVDQLDQAMADGSRRIVGQAPTGYGKTVIGEHLAKRITEARKRLLFTVPALELIDQTVERFWKNGIHDVGVIQANHPMTNYARPIQIASVQTLQRREIPRARPGDHR